MRLITCILASSILLISFAGKFQSFAFHKSTDISVLSPNAAKAHEHDGLAKSSIAQTDLPEQVLATERGSGRDKEEPLTQEQV